MEELSTLESRAFWCDVRDVAPLAGADGAVVWKISCPPTDGPGAVRVGAGEVELAPGRERVTAVLHNTGALPVWVSSHVPLDHLNPALRVHVPAEGRYRLDVPAGTAVRVDAGAEREVAVVRIGGTA